jgi:DNA helicase-2/ATP-dependent DNA helicase PcrA
MEDLSLGPSHLRFSESEDTRHNRHAAAALRGETQRKKPSNYTGKTYDSVDSVNDFFKRMASRSEQRSESKKQQEADGEYRVGSRVRHERYGSGVVVRIEGAGEDAKLTVNFPGYGQKKFVARFAALEKQ